MNAFGEPIDLKIGEKHTSILCFDLEMSRVQAVKHVKQLVDMGSTQGLKIVDVTFGQILKCDGRYFENKRHNKMMVIFEKTAFEKYELSPDLIGKFKRFFKDKIYD
jgi:hypothetical protein